MTSLAHGGSQPADQPIAQAGRVRIHHLAAAKRRGEVLTMLTAYDAMVAEVFDQAGIDILLVGDSIGTTALGMPSTLTVTLGDIERATAAVAGAARRALVVADLPFGTYEESSAQAIGSAVRLMRAGAHAVKLEGGLRMAKRTAAIVEAGIPVIGHIGFTPQSVHRLGGPRIQGRNPASEAELTQAALALQDSGAAALVLELMTAETARAITSALEVPTIGIGAGAGCDIQVLVWTDMAGLTLNPPRFVQTFGDLRRNLTEAATAYAMAVRGGTYPDADHSY
jgi:3-methyl-2-oxobutanoate hydroxymethyltransferase